MKHTLEQADELVLNSPYADRIEDYEYQPEGDLHVYTLDDGSALTLGPDGLHLVDEEGQHQPLEAPVGVAD